MDTSNGAAIKAIRQAKGWTGPKFAAALGITHGHLYNIENPEQRHNASVELIKRMADLLEVSVTALTSGYPVEEITDKRRRGRKTETPAAA